MIRFHVFVTFEQSSNLFYLRLVFTKAVYFTLSLSPKSIFLAIHFCIIANSSTWHHLYVGFLEGYFGWSHNADVQNWLSEID